MVAGGQVTDAGALRRVMGTFPTGVTVVAARREDRGPVGLTVNSLTSVSLDPPLVLVCIDREASSHDAIVETGSFAVSILGAHQADVARRFAGVASATGDPVVQGCVAWITCTLEAVHQGGDHSILVGRVTEADADEGASLVFYRGRFRRVAE